MLIRLHPTYLIYQGYSVDKAIHYVTQELGSMYDYLAKIVLLGPSGAGKFVRVQFIRHDFSVRVLTVL